MFSASASTLRQAGRTDELGGLVAHGAEGVRSLTAGAGHARVVGENDGPAGGEPAWGPGGPFQNPGSSKQPSTSRSNAILIKSGGLPAVVHDQQAHRALPVARGRKRPGPLLPQAHCPFRAYVAMSGVRQRGVPAVFGDWFFEEGTSGHLAGASLH